MTQMKKPVAVKLQIRLGLERSIIIHEIKGFQNWLSKAPPPPHDIFISYNTVINDKVI
jgi:hypothetical protein